MNTLFIIALLLHFGRFGPPAKRLYYTTSGVLKMSREKRGFFTAEHTGNAKRRRAGYG
jgi:hypothetical protein